MTALDASLELLPFEEACARVVDFLAEVAPMAAWSVTRVEDGRQTHLAVRDDAYGVVAGDSHVWADSLCSHMVAGTAPAVAPDAMAVPQYAAAAAALGMPVGAYAGAPIRAGDGALFGTICGFDPERAPAGVLTGASGLLLLADLLGRVLEASTLRAAAEERARQVQEAQAALARSEATHRLLLARTRDAISRHDATGALTYVSPAGLAVFGRTPEAMHGWGWRDLLHPDDRDGTGALATTGPGGEATFRVRHGDGHWVWVESTWTILRDDAGSVVEVLVCSRDITARRARDTASQRESLERLSAGLAHGINTPMQYVGDNARFLAEAFEELMGLVESSTGSSVREGPSSADPAAGAGSEVALLQTEVLSAVSQTLVGIDRVAAVVRAMRTFSSPGEGGHVFTDLNAALAAAVTVVRDQVDPVADLTLELRELPPVRCEAASLNQALLALLVNAAEAVAESGRRGAVRVCTAVDGHEVVIAVADTGVGIPPGDRARVFEPFFTTKRIGRGTGQGLALARAVVQDGHGGTLSVASAPGAGTTMTVRLPIAGPAAPQG